MQSLSVQQLQETSSSNPDKPKLIDVRSPAEYRAVHVRFAESRPLDQLDPDTIREHYAPTEQRPLYLICKSGSRSRQAQKKLAAAGIEHTATVEGGTDAWVDAGYDVERGQSVMSIERQVRIAAGSLVALGVALGWWASPWFLLLPLFIGCGLVFSGISNTCGMGSVLLKMPWNR
jgi:rhodanese-related sulfurtransferase